MDLKTLADLKRDLKVGTRIVMTYNRFPPISSSATNLIGVERTISAVQSNQIKIETRKNDGKIVQSYLEFPRAINLAYKDDKFDIYDDKGNIELSYKILSQ